MLHNGTATRSDTKFAVTQFDYLESSIQSRVLSGDEVHVWLACIDDEIEPDRSAVMTILTGSEAERARSFRFDADRRRWTRSRLILRDLLSRYVDELAREIAISDVELEKPMLIDHPEIEFNLSHSGDAVLVAISRTRRVGLDIEQIVPSKAERSVARTVYSTRELDWLEKLEGDDWTSGFFRCWVRKEAVVKATGEGLSAELVSITATPSGDDLSVHSHDGFSILNLSAPAGYAAALAVSTEPR